MDVAMGVVIGVVIGMGIVISLSLILLVGVGDRLGGMGAVNVYRAGLADGVRVGERLAAGGSVTRIVDRRHGAMEVHRG